MEKQQAFYILELEETKDENLIRSAYLDHLKHVNPEDNPEGFKRLRTAYETALFLARRPEADATAVKTEIDLWLDKADDIYRDIRRRIQADLWQELFTDPVCRDFDVSLEARERFIAYLTDHYYLPRNVWKTIDDEFRIVDDIEHLKKNIHENFLNYAKYNIENDGFITYYNFISLDSPDKESQTDSYIKKYLAIKQKLDSGEHQDIWQELDDLAAFGVYHPYEDVERLRLLLIEKRLTEAEALCEDLQDQYPVDSYVTVHAANCRWALDQPERALSLWKQLLDILPDNETSKIGLVKYYLKIGKYDEAKEYALEILETHPHHPEAITLLDETNNYLIDQYRSQLSKDPDPDMGSYRALHYKLGWCYFQNRNYSEGINLLKDLTPEQVDDYEYHNLFSRILVANEEYEQALPYLQRWLTLIMETPDDGSEESNKRLKRKPLAYYLIGWCHHALGRHSQGIEQVTQSLEYSMPVADRLSFMLNLSRIHIANEDCQKAIDVADAILKEDASYFPAYLSRMDAAYKLGNGQLVVDDFYRAIDIYSGFPKLYVLAMSVFVDYNQYKEASGIIKLARENNVSFSDQMLLYEVRIRRNLSQNNEETLKILELCQLLDERMAKKEGEQTDLKDTSEIHFEMGLLYWNVEDNAQALTWIRKAQLENPQRDQYNYVEANILSSDQQYQEALDIYMKMPASQKQFAAYHYHVGLCYEGMENYKQAINFYVEALKRNKQYRDTANKLSHIYLKLFKENYVKFVFQEAVKYASKQLEADNCAYYLIERGNVYEAGMLLEDAMADYRQALKYEPDNHRAYYNIGYCYMLMGRFTEAIESLTTTIKIMAEKNINHHAPYDDLARCYETLGDYETAIKHIRNYLKMHDYFPFEERVAQYYYYSKQYQEAIDLYRDIAKRRGVPELEYGKQIGDAYFYLGLRSKASFTYWKMIQYKANFQNLLDAADFFHKDMKKMRRAGYYYSKALMQSASPAERSAIALSLAEFYYDRHNFRWSKKYAAQAYKIYIATYGSEDVFLNYLPNRPKHLVRIGKCYLFMGDREKALTFFEQIDKCYRCNRCRRIRCSELFENRAVYYKSRKEWQKAIADYQAAYDIPPNQQDGRIVAEVERLKRLIK